MLTKLTHIATRQLSALLAAVLCLLAACDSSSDVPAIGDEVKSLHTVFSLTVSDTAGSTSRAQGILGPGYDTGAGYENFIDVENPASYRFYFFGEDDKFISNVEIYSITPVESYNSSKTYIVDAQSDEDLRDRRLKVVALANWPQFPDALTPGQTTIEQLWQYTYSFSQASMNLSATTVIPLYGVTNIKTLTFDVLNRADLGTIHLLRAYAKVEVMPTDDSVYPIRSVKLHRYSTSGYCAPDGVRLQDHYVYGSYDKDYTSTPHVPANSEADADLDFKPTEAGTWIAYVPEYPNKGRREDLKATIRIAFDGQADDYDYDVVHFKTYTNGIAGESFDILRNVWYKFSVKKKSPPIVQVVPYNEVDLGPVFGLYTGPELVPIFDDDGIIVYWFDSITGKYYGSDGKTELLSPPYITIDPVTGWTIIRNLLDEIIGYYDGENNQYYDKDKNPLTGPPA